MTVLFRRDRNLPEGLHAHERIGADPEARAERAHALMDDELDVRRGAGDAFQQARRAREGEIGSLGDADARAVLAFHDAEQRLGVAREDD